MDLEVLRPNVSTIKLQSNDPITQQVHRFYHQIGSIISIETREFAESLNENLQVLGQASLFRFLSALCPFLFLFFLFLFSHVLSLSRPLCVFFFVFVRPLSVFFLLFRSLYSFLALVPLFLLLFFHFFSLKLVTVYARLRLLCFSIRLCCFLLCLLCFLSPLCFSVRPLVLSVCSQSPGLPLFALVIYM